MVKSMSFVFALMMIVMLSFAMCGCCTTSRVIVVEPMPSNVNPPFTARRIKYELKESVEMKDAFDSKSPTATASVGFSQSW